jgi:uncharacterized protein (DUF488 family)
LGSDTSNVVWTIGHSNRTFDEFALALRDAQIELIVDVRRFPGSRRLPQFASEALQAELETRGIAYDWIPALGGRRRTGSESADTGWTHPAFRAYAAHVETEEFAEGLFELLMLAGGLRTAIMCAEVLWWRCHRRIIADVLVSLGVQVVHLFAPEKREVHRLREPARLEDGRLTYDR